MDSVSDELLRQLGLIAIAIQRDKDDPQCLLAEIEDDEQAAEIAATVHTCGARLYSMSLRRRSLEQLFFPPLKP